MKTKLILLSIGLAITASAQQPFVFKFERKTNVANVPAQHVTAAHTVTTIAEIAYVATASDKGIEPWQQPAVHIVSVTTNLVDQVKKPLLSAQKPAPIGVAPTKQKPTPIGVAPPTNVLNKPVATQSKPQVKNTNAPVEYTNSVAYKRAHKIPPYDK